MSGNLQRLQAVLDAYGADAARWPAAERAALETVSTRGEGAALLAEAASLDGWLDASRDATASSAALGAALAGIERSQARRRRLRRWWAGAVLAGLGLAGAAAGATAAVLLTPASAAVQVYDGPGSAFVYADPFGGS